MKPERPELFRYEVAETRADIRAHPSCARTPVLHASPAAKSSETADPGVSAPISRLCEIANPFELLPNCETKRSLGRVPGKAIYLIRMRLFRIIAPPVFRPCR